MGDSRTDTAALRITREESRSVLDHRLELSNDLDDKAMWTVRTAILLLTLLASAAAIEGVSAVKSVPNGAKVSFGLAVGGLFATVFLGLGAYFVSTTTFGVGESHRREVRDVAYTEREWLEVLLDGYDAWIRQMDRRNEENARSVFWSQALLVVSLLFVFIGTTLLAIGGQ